MIQIKRMADYDHDIRDDVADVFVDGYYRNLSFFTKDRTKLKAAFCNLFCPDVFYVAEVDGEIVGILACSNNRQPAMAIDKPSLKEAFGFLMGSMAYLTLDKEFNAVLPYEDDTGYIECVATSERARGKGVSTALFKHVMQELPYRHYILEVVDTNVVALQMYKNLGFDIYERKQEKLSRIKGFKERIYMKWSKGGVSDLPVDLFSCKRLHGLFYS
ncbi:GNAT family N-acetyltransferase [Paenibacillus mendelii]|uniref:GNAT family N-acetyltransferase n=1 Tax=Paenibacillus mendelii TaxID=206163 RepID=A0ABV6J5F3_9BACL|nr:GNAT family N-acetyltransferase [Paenibacillus mendelii]MCQ6560221.1 GNAT family N-acetyltransferase [Paenibacillus mendelii]